VTVGSDAAETNRGPRRFDGGHGTFDRVTGQFDRSYPTSAGGPAVLGSIKPGCPGACCLRRL